MLEARLRPNKLNRRRFFETIVITGLSEDGEWEAVFSHRTTNGSQEGQALEEKTKIRFQERASLEVTNCVFEIDSIIPK